MIKGELNKTVSVIVLSYKNTDGIYPTLDSIFMQTYSKIDLIISDDGTPGFQEDISKIETYIKDHSSNNIIRVTINDHEVNGGTVRNVNSALRIAKGDYIKLLSSEDCLAHNKALEDYVEYMENHHCLICFGKMRGVTKDGVFMDELLSCDSDYDLLKTYSLKQQKNRLFARNYLPAPAAFFDRQIFERFGLFDEDICLIEDYPYWIHLTKYRVKFSYIDEIVVYYRLSGVSSSGHYSEKFMNDMFVIYNKYIFPYDNRYGVFQKIYNKLKYDGLMHYLERAKMEKYSINKKIWVYIRYFPFFVYTDLQKLQIELKNKRGLTEK